MKHLNDMFNEGLSPSLKQKLLDLINDPNLTDKAGISALNRLKYTGRLGLSTGEFETIPGELKDTGKTYIDNSANRKSGRVGQPIYKLSKPTKKEIVDDDSFDIYNHLKNINVEQNKIKQIMDILLNEDEMDHYVEYINKNNSDSLWYKSNDLINKSNIFDSLANTNIKRVTLKELAELKANKKDVSQGQFEIILKMFLGDLSKNNDPYNSNNHGDVYAGGYAFEIKGDKSRVGSATRDPNLIRNKLNNLFKSYNPKITFNYDPFSKEENIAKSIPIIIQNTPNKEIAFDVIYESLCAQFLKDSPKLSKSDKLRLINDIFTEVKGTYPKLKRFMMAIQLYFYQLDEGFNYFMLIDNNSGDYICIPSSDISIVNIFYNQPHIKVHGGKGGNSLDKRDQFCQISYQK